MSFRDIKAKARRDLHLGPTGLGVAAFYFRPIELPRGKTDVSDGKTAPATYTVRVHNKWDAKGDQAGTSLHSAERTEDTPQVVFWWDQLKWPLIRNGVIMISDSEGYRIDNVDPRYLQTQTAKVIPLPPKELAKYPFPDKLQRYAFGDVTMFLPVLDYHERAMPLPVVDATAVQLNTATIDVTLSMVV